MRGGESFGCIARSISHNISLIQFPIWQPAMRRLKAWGNGWRQNRLALRRWQRPTPHSVSVDIAGLSGAAEVEERGTVVFNCIAVVGIRYHWHLNSKAGCSLFASFPFLLPQWVRSVFENPHELKVFQFQNSFISMIECCSFHIFLWHHLR